MLRINILRVRDNIAEECQDGGCGVEEDDPNFSELANCFSINYGWWDIPETFPFHDGKDSLEVGQGRAACCDGQADTRCDALEGRACEFNFRSLSTARLVDGDYAVVVCEP